MLTAAIIAGCGTDSAEPDASQEKTEPEAQQTDDTEPKTNIEEIEFPHMHGIGFTSDGEKAFIPAHDGLRVFEDGIWKRVEGPRHDYMGFSMTADGFYSSGHPSMQTDYENPLGIIKSTDGGKSIEVLGLEGEVDFHLMSAGYNSGAIYVMNPQPNSDMEDTGLYLTNNEAKDWKKRDMNGVSGSITSLAAHPDQQGIGAVSTEEGVFLSQDSGDTFEQLLESPVPALTFTHDGEMLAAKGIGKETTLQAIDSSGET
ncbi:F510_1955 family glycosylhydrolase [Alteribacillus bidgolensis]|uniref:Glycosyl hydrolase n=1 Tax=Alteribacillus bidgolensis TaxID=930129 RepID=A0A1G8RNC4_9BACI|nr:hypothetical protein [Alteribacillus bidgolensis]SDJ18402.1 hypothetical protein SAMN05216352_1306 [Alteribacillus bidgolensis]